MTWSEEESTRQRGQPYDHETFARLVREAVAEVVRKQVEAGIDMVTNGEQVRKVFLATSLNALLSGRVVAVVTAGTASIPVRDRSAIRDRWLYRRGRQSAARARIPHVRAGQTTRRQNPHPQGDQPSDMNLDDMPLTLAFGAEISATYAPVIGDDPN